MTEGIWKEIADFASADTELLATVAFGFLGYRIAYAERVASDDMPNIVFLSACFALVAGLLVDFFKSIHFTDAETLLFAFFGTIGIAALWRIVGIRLYARAWRAAGASHHDGQETALDSVRLDAGFSPTQIKVSLIDGSALFCDNLHKFKDEGFGPCKIGSDGSVSLYVTHYYSKTEGEWRETDHVQGEFGSLSTYVPSDQIRLIEVRN